MGLACENSSAFSEAVPTLALSLQKYKPTECHKTVLLGRAYSAAAVIFAYPIQKIPAQGGAVLGMMRG